MKKPKISKPKNVLSFTLNIDNIYESFENMSERAQIEIITNLTEISKPKHYVDFMDAIINAADLTETQYKEIGRESFGIEFDGPERDTAANTNYKY